MQLEPLEKFSSIQPQMPLLQKHIAYYYFQQTLEDTFSRTFSYYPNHQVALNVFQGAEIKWNKNQRFTLPIKHQKPTAIITLSTQKRRQVVAKGKFNKIGIIFEPLGFSHFIDQPLYRIIKETINPFDYYDASFTKVIDQVFQADSLVKKRDLLDAFFIRQYTPIAIAELSLAVQKIIQTNGHITLNELALQYRISRKTLLRLFQKHMGQHVRGFSNLVKFRNALSLYKRHQYQMNLTQLAYECQFNDQSAFIKNIKAFTGLTPSKLFLGQNDIGGKHTVWTTEFKG